MECVFVIMAHVVFFWFVATADKWTLFQRLRSVDGKICQGADLAFTKAFIYDKTLCSRECVNHVNCKSIFHVQHTGNCTGCTVSYGTATNPTGLVSGTIYYDYFNCPDGWFKIKDSCYFISDEDTSFEKGVEICMSQNAHAVIINDEDENKNLKSKINTLTFPGNVKGFFTAYTDVDTEGTWVAYGTTNELTFTDWEDNEPNGNVGENCMALWIASNLHWVDVDCNDGQCRIICEKET